MTRGKNAFEQTAVMMAWLSVLAAATLQAGEGSAGNCDPPTVPVRASVTFTNNTGQTANDFHLYMYQNDKPHVFVTGAKASCSAFGTVGVTPGTDNGQPPPPPPGNHGADVDMSGGSVPPGGSIKVDLTLCMNERNNVKIKDVKWTHDGNDLGGGSPNHGFRVNRPTPGGGGGNHTPGGGGKGAQEGSGGTGKYVHRICIENDDTVPILLEELKLLASMTYYPNISLINWSAIDPIQNDNGEPPVVIAPMSVWCFDMETTGTYVGGHIYLKYSVRPAPLPAEAGLAVAEEDDSVLTFGDHPVDDIELDLAEGSDYWETTQITSILFGGSIPPIPPDFFDPGSLPFTGDVLLQGRPLDLCLGNADTIIVRRAPLDLPFDGMAGTIPIELVQMSLVSVNPIIVPFGSQPPRLYDVHVEVQPFMPGFGMMFVQRDSHEGGQFGMQIQYVPQIHFVEVGTGTTRTLSEVPPQLMQTPALGPWQYAPPPRRIEGSGPNFYAQPDWLRVAVHPDGTTHSMVPAMGRAPGDCDCDADVDLADFAIFQSSFNGPNRPYADPEFGGCMDLDGDGDVDLQDFAQFQTCFNGPNRPPACP